MGIRAQVNLKLVYLSKRRYIPGIECKNLVSINYTRLRSKERKASEMTSLEISRSNKQKCLLRKVPKPQSIINTTKKDLLHVGCPRDFEVVLTFK